MSVTFDRRTAIKGILAGTVTLGVPSELLALANPKDELKLDLILKGKINHSVARWCFNDFDIETLCSEAKKIGITGIDLVGPEDWPTLKKHNLVSTMCNGAELNLVDGFNDQKFHEQLIKNYTKMIPFVAEAGYKNLICFSGNRRGKTDEEGWKNCVLGLQKLIPLAEKHNVILVMELLNSKINHKDYQCSKTSWGVELAKRINSENFKLLYDIYHMQIMEGDVIATIRKYHKYISHYHTGGVPGRNEIDETQELYYPAIMKAITETGYKGFVGQEFVPSRKDDIASLKQGVTICDIA